MSIEKHLAESMRKHGEKHKKKKESHKESKMRRMEIEPADNEGFTVTHHMEQDEDEPRYKEPEKHVFKNHKDLMKHVKKHFSPNEGDDDGDEAGEMK